ncbi:MAG: GFA family protein [Methylohalobius sp. ZOD2]
MELTAAPGWYVLFNWEVFLIHRGGCHCGTVTFEVEAPENLKVSECNCSICAKSGYLHLVVPRSRFRLLSGAENLETYTFGTNTAKHLFCKTCGIKSFYIPRSHPEGISVNARCLEGSTVQSIHAKPFDGQNWEANVHKLKPLGDA